MARRPRRPSPSRRPPGRARSRGRAPRRARRARRLAPVASESERLAAALPDYDIGRELGRGDFGVVLEATDRRSGRVVAVKLLTVAATTDPGVGERLAADRSRLTSLDHPHVVRVIDAVDHEGAAVFVMERVD